MASVSVFFCYNKYMTEIIYIALVVIVAGGVGTLTGFGNSTIMVPVLLLFFPLAPTLLLTGIIHSFGDIWNILLFRHGIRRRLALLFGIPGVLLAFVGARLVFSIPEEILSRALGIFLVAYVLFLFLSSRYSSGGWRMKQSAVIAVISGAVSGFAAGIFGIGGVIRGAFLSAFGLPKAVYIATIGAVGLAINSTRTVTYFYQGANLTSELYWGLLLFIPASFAGAWLAKKIVNKIPEKQFRAVVAVFLLIFGLKLLFFPG